MAIFKINYKNTHLPNSIKIAKFALVKLLHAF
jgi:hypothetical protein